MRVFLTGACLRVKTVAGKAASKHMEAVDVRNAVCERHVTVCACAF